MMNRDLTPTTYLRELLANSWIHRGELIAAVGCGIAVVLAALAMRSRLRWPELSALAIGAVLLLEMGAAAWRLHRRQSVALATTHTLLDLDAGEREELGQRLLARYRRRERRIGDRNEARIERLNNEIAALNAR